MCKEELHGGALDPPALGDAVEEPRSVVVHDKLEKGALGDERNIVIFKTINITVWDPPAIQHRRFWTISLNLG